MDLSYIPARQLLLVGSDLLETSLTPGSKHPNGSRFRPPAAGVDCYQFA